MPRSPGVGVGWLQGVWVPLGVMWGVWVPPGRGWVPWGWLAPGGLGAPRSPGGGGRVAPGGLGARRGDTGAPPQTPTTTSCI